MKNALIVFVKNPVFGKVKTRLAKTMGDEKALSVYQKLIAHTQFVCNKVNAVRFVFYSDFIEDNDNWEGFEKRLQSSGDLGDKMQAAFFEIFEAGFEKAIVIGSDCPEITTGVINAAFTSLNHYDTVIGPAVDGGYYLLGMSKLYPSFFENKSWSTSAVLQQTIDSVNNLQLSFYLLAKLKDIDEEKDLEGTSLLKE